MKSKYLVVFLAAVLIGGPTASAHYLWIALAEGKLANIYFEEGPAAGDGRYLDHFKTTRKTWLRTISNPNPKLIEAQDISKSKKRWLQASLPDSKPCSVDCYAKFGVYAYGKTNVLLHYYARNLNVRTHEDLHELGRAEQMDLDIIPHDFGSKVTLKVLWRSKPSKARTVYIRGPKGFRSNLKTDANGKVTFNAEAQGRYTFRTNVEENIAGKDGGKDYSLIRHHATLVMNFPLEK